MDITLERMSWSPVVALVTSLITVVGALLVVLVTARIGAANQVRLSNAEQNAKRRHDAYLRVAEFCVRLRAAALYPGVDASEAMLESVVDDDGAWWAVQARTSVYGSAEVRTQFEGLLTRRTQLLGARRTWRDVRAATGSPGPAEVSSLELLRSRSAETAEACVVLLATLNAELSP